MDKFSKAAKISFPAGMKTGISSFRKKTEKQGGVGLDALRF